MKMRVSILAGLLVLAIGPAFAEDDKKTGGDSNPAPIGLEEVLEKTNALREQAGNLKRELELQTRLIQQREKEMEDLQRIREALAYLGFQKNENDAWTLADAPSASRDRYKISLNIKNRHITGATFSVGFRVLENSLRYVDYTIARKDGELVAYLQRFTDERGRLDPRKLAEQRETSSWIEDTENYARTTERDVLPKVVAALEAKGLRKESPFSYVLRTDKARIGAKIYFDPKYRDFTVSLYAVPASPGDGYGDDTITLNSLLSDPSHLALLDGWIGQAAAGRLF